MLELTVVELLLYGALLLIWNGVSAYSNHLSYTRCFGGSVHSGESVRLSSRCLGLYTISMTALVGCDKGRSRFIRCRLVIVMYLIATSPLAVRMIFVQGSDDETQETPHIYLPGWILLSSASFIENVLITNSIAVRSHHKIYLLEWVDTGLDVVVLAPLWLQMDVLCHSRAMHHCWNEFVPFIVIVKWALTSSLVFAGVGLYKMTATPATGNACAAQIDWMLPYFSMTLAVTLLCMAVIVYGIITGPRIGPRTPQLWIKVIVESLLLLAVAPTVFLVLYITSETRRDCPLLVVTMIMVRFSSMCSPHRC